MSTFVTSGIFFYFRHFSTPCIRHYAWGQLGSSEMRGSTITISSKLNVQIEDGSIDDLINQPSYTKATKMSPWPPKMATAQAFWKGQWIILLVAGGGREGFSHPYFQGWQAFYTILGNLNTLLSPSINKPWYFGSWTSGSLPDLHVLAGPPAHCWSSSHWVFQILDLQLMEFVFKGSTNAGWPSKRENGNSNIATFCNNNLIAWLLYNHLEHRFKIQLVPVTIIVHCRLGWTC